MSNKAPFRIKQLLNNFKEVKNEHFIQRLDIAVFAIELIYNKAKDNFLYNEKNHYLFSKTLFEECLSVSNNFIKDEEQAKMDLNLMKKYKEMIEDCDKKIKFISAISLSEIESLKEKEKLFNNEKKWEKDDLSLLSYNLNLAVKKINNIENLNNNEEALETKSFYLANIVKIELLKKDKNINLERLGKFAQESISIAQKLKKNCKNKPWYKEIVKLNDEIYNKMKELKPAPLVNVIDIDDVGDKFLELLEQGNEQLLRYILQNYPYNGYIFNEESIDNYKNNKKKFLMDLRKEYGINDYNNFHMNKTDDNMSELNDLILEYIDKMIDKVEQNE